MKNFPVIRRFSFTFLPLFIAYNVKSSLYGCFFLSCPQNDAPYILTPSLRQVGNRNRRFCLPLRNEGLTSTLQYRNPDSENVGSKQ